MANTNKPSGFTPVKYLNGADWDGRGNVYAVSKDSTNAIRVGDLVTKDLTLSHTQDTNGLMMVDLAASTNLVVGCVIAIGTQYSGPYVDPTNLTLNYAPATKTQEYFVLVADDPNIIYEIQEQSGATQLSSKYIGCNTNFVVAAPAAGVNISGWQLASVTTTTPVATATLDCRILGLAQKYDNGAKNTFGAYAKWLVKLNLVATAGATGYAAAT